MVRAEEESCREREESRADAGEGGVAEEEDVKSERGVEARASDAKGRMRVVVKRRGGGEDEANEQNERFK